VTVGFGLEAPGERPAVEELMRSNEWETNLLDEGEVLVAGDGDEVIGVVHGTQVAPGSFYVASALVRADRRGKGIGAGLMRMVALGRPGAIYLACHDNRVAFYERLGFTSIEEPDLPKAAREYAYRAKDLPHKPDHVHHLMRRGA